MKDSQPPPVFHGKSFSLYVPALKFDLPPKIENIGGGMLKVTFFEPETCTVLRTEIKPAE